MRKGRTPTLRNMNKEYFFLVKFIESIFFPRADAPVKLKRFTITFSIMVTFC